VYANLKYVDLGFTEIVLTNSGLQRDRLVNLISKEIKSMH